MVSTGFLVVISVIGGIVGGWIIIMTSSSLSELAWKAAVGLIIYNLLIRVLRWNQTKVPAKHGIILNLVYCLAFLAILGFVFAGISAIH